MRLPFATPLTAALLALAAGPAAAADPAPPAPVSNRAEGPTFEVLLDPPASAKPGKPASARVVIRSRGPYHVNRDYPLAFEPAEDATAWPARDRIPLSAGERTPCADQAGEACTVAAPLAFTPAAAGAVRVSGTVRFSVCSAERCLIEKQPLALTVTVR